MSQKSADARQTLPLPVTVKVDTQVHWQGRIDVVPVLVAFSSGLVALSSDQPKVSLLFISASIVITGLYFMIVPADDEETHPVVTSCLKKLPTVFSALSCILIMIGIGLTFQNEVVMVIPLFLFISFIMLAALFGTVIPAWISVILYAVGLVSLLSFAVLACIS